MERGLCTFVKRRREKQRARAAQRRTPSGVGVPTSPRRTAAGLPRGGERDITRPKLVGMLLRTGLMAVGSITVARHAVGAGPHVAGAVGSVLLGRARRRSAPC